MELVILNILNGISFGSILFLVGSGLSLIWGVMGILNLAHGALYMVGAFVGWTVAVRNGMNFWLAILAGAALGGLLGLIMERFFFRYLHKQFTEQVLLTFGFIYILQNVALWIYGGLPKAAYTAPTLNVTFPLMSGTYPLARIAITIIGIILAVGLWWLQAKTRVGAIIRAGMDDKEMTTGLGINFALVSTLVFCLGACIAGASGVIGAQLFGVTIELALSILLLALVVVVLGGVGSILGTLVGGIVIGLILSFGKALFPQVSMFLVYFIMILILVVKPEGLLGRKS